MPTVNTLNPYSFAFNGFIFGGTDSPYQIQSVDGLEGLPAVRNQDDNRGYFDGMFTGNDFYSGRTITINMQILSGKPTLTIANAVAGATTLTYTTNIPHNYTSGQTVTVTNILSTGNPTGTANAGFNRTGVITVTNNYNFEITYTLTDTYTSGGLVVNSTTFSASQNLDYMQAAMQVQPSGTTPLQFRLAITSTIKRVNARVRDRKVLVDPDYTYGLINATYIFFSPDPRIYDDTEQSVTIPISGAFGLGRVYNFLFPREYDVNIVSSTTDATNNGTANTYPVITANGPAVNPTFGNFSQNLYITVNGTFAQSDTISIDTDARTILVNGNPARNLIAAGSNWFYLPPGTSQVYFAATGVVSGITSASLSWRSANI